MSFESADGGWEPRLGKNQLTRIPVNIGWERNRCILDSNMDKRAQFVNGDPCARREWLIDRVSALTEEAAGETTIKVDFLGEIGNWKTRFVEGEGERAIVALRDEVVEEDRAGLIMMANSNTIKCLGLGGRAWFGIVGIIVEITTEKILKKRLRLRRGAMDKFVGSGKFVAKTTWDLIDHHDRVADGIVPKLPVNFLFSDKSSCHGDNGTSYALGETFGWLAASRSGNNVRFVEDDPFFEGFTSN